MLFCIFVLDPIVTLRGPNYGLVKVSKHGVTGIICEEENKTWSQQETDVICKQTGYGCNPS